MVTRITFTFSKEFGGTDEADIFEKVNEFIMHAGDGVGLSEGLALDVVDEQIVPDHESLDN